ncbi:MAG: DUF4126 domain-containing protein [Thermodesulfobacteriota bacterium]|nr:DUF4126 domain-containing protein [Thermodesulfobacteriota bacterium]
MEAIAQLGSILGLSFISGINLYATVAVTGICVRNGLIQGLPPEFQVFANDAVIFIALFLYVIEFFLDKIQGLDTLWDSLHTVIRPLGGAIVALMQVGEASPAVEVIVFMLGATMASSAHIAKAGTRLVVNASPEPVSNILLSTAEDIGAIGYSYLALTYPKLTFFLTLACVGLILYFLPLLFRTIRMLFYSLLFRIKSFLVRNKAKSELPLLPYSMDTFFEEQKGDDEKIIWAGRAYSASIPSIPKSMRIHMLITSQAIHCLYRRWFRHHIKSLSRSEIRQDKCYSGRLLAKYQIKTRDETWLLQLYQPLSKTLPPGLAIQKGYEVSQLSVL